MSPELSPRAVAGKAREVVATVRPGATEARRSLPIRSPEAELRRLWEEPAELAKVIAGIPVAEATLTLGPERGDWGRTATVWLRLESAVPGMAAALFAGKVVRRLKALAETGEVPTTEANPSGRRS
jgi:hypothetical protein